MRCPAPLVTTSEHGERFAAAVEKGVLSATQFHPEKSGDAGAQLLANWVADPVNRYGVLTRFDRLKLVLGYLLAAAGGLAVLRQSAPPASPSR